jgi:hypothetical protein
MTVLSLGYRVALSVSRCLHSCVIVFVELSESLCVCVFAWLNSLCGCVCLSVSASASVSVSVSVSVSLSLARSLARALSLSLFLSLSLSRVCVCVQVGKPVTEEEIVRQLKSGARGSEMARGRQDATGMLPIYTIY